MRSILQRQNNKQRIQYGKSVEHEQWQSTTGISITAGHKRVLKQPKGIKIEGLEKSECAERKWTDSQYLDK